MGAVIVTGGARGQGSAHAERFAQGGDRVFLADVLDEEGQAVADRLTRNGAQAIYRHLDITDAGGWETLVGEIAESGEHLRVLVNNAGVSQREPGLVHLSEAEWDRVLAANLKGAYLGIRAAAPLMEGGGGGTIINVGSAAGLTGNPHAAYVSAKWGLRGLTRAAAFELSGVGIRAHCIHPGIVETPMTLRAPAGIEMMRRHTPLGRAATVEEIAEIAYFLASDAAAYLTALDVPIDGGFTELGQFWNMIRSAGEGHAGA